MEPSVLAGRRVIELRYLEEAAELDEPVEVLETTVPITLKLPPTTVRALRVYARSSGLTISEASGYGRQRGHKDFDVDPLVKGSMASDHRRQGRLTDEHQREAHLSLNG